MAAFLVLVVILADTRSLGFMSFIYRVEHGDKVGHFMLFGMLAFFITLAVRHLQRDPSTRRALVGSGVLAIVMSLEELSQLFFPSRSPDPFDLLAGYAGIAVWTWLALVLAPMLGIEGADDRGVELRRRRDS